MAVVRNSGELISYISGVLPDNNAGQISASDVRSSIVDTVASIVAIVSSGDFIEYPFVNNIKIVRTQGQSNTGSLIVESGIRFPNSSDGNQLQLVPYPGPGAINHNSLQNLTADDPHTQYIPANGGRPFTSNVAMGNMWVNASGSSTIQSTNGKGLRFMYSSDATRETIDVGSGTQFTFLKDNSVLTSARGIAKAWIRFEASGVGGPGTPVVLDSYNVSGIRKEAIGKFTIIFHSGVFANNNYVAIGHSNGRSQASSRDDFSENTVGLAYRVGDDVTKLRSISFSVLSEDTGAYLDGIVNDLVVFGTEPRGSGNPPVTINPNYTA